MHMKRDFIHIEIIIDINKKDMMHIEIIIHIKVRYDIHRNNHTCKRDLKYIEK